MRPLIGITAEIAPVTRYWGTDEHHLLDGDYVQAVTAAGALAVVLPVGTPEDAGAVLARLDGLVLSGGNDLDPSTYGQQRVDAGTGGEPDPTRDAWELALARHAIAAAVPTLAICRGMQLVNVACGGTLVQHVPGHDRTSHVVRVEAGSGLARHHPDLTDVNSHHHQAVDRPGDGVRVVATSPDGVIEAIEISGAPNLVAVQWHPEMLPDHPTQAALFRRLVTAAGG